MSLFGDKENTDVVTAEDIKELTGVQPQSLYLHKKEKPDKALDDLLEKWIDRMCAQVHIRLKREVREDHSEMEAMTDVVTRLVAKLVGVAQQQRSTPVIQINDFAIEVINTSDVIKDIKKELKPFKKRRVSFFTSADEPEE